MGPQVTKFAVVVSLVTFACASAPPKPHYYVRVAQSGHEHRNVYAGEKGSCWGVMFAHVAHSDPVLIECPGAFKVDRCLTTEWKIDVGQRLKKTFIFRDPDTDEMLACRTGWVSCYDDAVVTGGGVCYPEQVAGLALKRNTGKPRLSVRHPKMLLPGTAGPYGASVTFFVEVLGEVTEEWYCPALEVIWSDGTKTFEESDCDPWDGTQTQGARWSFRRGLGIGEHHIEFRLSKAGRTFAVEKIVATVRGGE
jgi:hypothetical protein